jgi:hypothetical protein
MRKASTAALVAAFLAGTLSNYACAATTAGVAEDLKTDKLKSLTRREAKVSDLIPKVEARVAALKANSATAAYGDRLGHELIEIEMFGPGESDERLKADMDFLQTAAAANQPPTSDELKPLQERYARLMAKLDDTALVKDYDRLLKRHDKLVRYAAAGIWDKDKIASELEQMEQMAESAPDIAFGAAESLRGLQQRRLAAVDKLVYLGTHPHEEWYLSRNRRSVGVLEEGAGGSVPIENADLTIQNADGSLVDLSAANNVSAGAPFSPPLSLWMKTRMVEGKVPSITFRLPETVANGQPLGAQDIIDGKLDDYFKRNLQAIAETKEAAIVGLFTDFDRGLAANAFGKDGRTPFYMLDPKMKETGEAAHAEYLKRSEKGVYANAKVLWPELSNQYGDPNTPDGPERVRDAWKHIRALAGDTTPNVAYFSTAGAYHGSKSAYKFEPTAGTQAWNKLEYYWPGKDVLDWLGIEAVGPDPASDPKGPNIVEAVDPFFYEVRTSDWQAVPVVLRAVSPSTTPNPSLEPNWILSLFSQMIPGKYPNVSIVFVDAPEKLTLWSRDSAAAYRTNVASNKFYKWPLRFKMLEQPQQQ